MKFAVETWAPEYGIAADESLIDKTSDTVDVDVEVVAEKWTPIDAPVPTETPDIVFVDGVQRIDARVWINDGDAVRAGVCAVVAAGAVRCSPGKATIIGHEVERLLLTGPSDVVDDIETRHGRYRYVSTASDAPEDVYLGIHEERNRLEIGFGDLDDGDLLIFDGPLRGRNNPKGVGYIKTQHVQYLPDAQQSVLAELASGQRTPLFHVAGRGQSRLSWYLRLPVERTHPWAGIVRAELPPGNIERAVERADVVSALLPGYASEPHKDGRAPQNLYPIAGLENDLRRRLGDQKLMERALRVAAA